MRKGAAGSLVLTPSSATSVVSTFADVAYSKNAVGATRWRFYFVVVVDIIAQSYPQFKQNLQNFSTIIFLGVI